MARVRQALAAFNRGLISRFGLARAADIERIALAAEVMTNWVPRVLGSMLLRPGLEYLGATRQNLPARVLPFVFATDQTALLEVTDSTLRVLVDDEPITRPAVTDGPANLANPDFTFDLASWTDADESGATSTWVTGSHMGLRGTGTNAAIREQQVSVAADVGTKHALRIRIGRGPVQFRVRNSADADLFAETTLETGWHSIAFTPDTADITLRFANRLNRQTLVSSCNFETGGTLELAAPWAEAALGDLRYAQSGDVVFIAAAGYRQQRIERRLNGSWSIVDYQSRDGPFRVIDVSGVTITPSALSGNITLTASGEIFRSTNVGSLYRLESPGQTVTEDIAAENTFTNSIKVFGTGSQRSFGITVTGLTSSGSTVVLQRSVDDVVWTDVSGQSYTANQSKSFDDALDNQELFYRIGVKTGGYSSGTHVCTLRYDLGSISGVAQVTAFSSATEVSATVLTELGSTAAHRDWSEGAWSTRRGFPSSVEFHEGRLWWFGKNGIWGSVSDAFDSFDPDTEGDSGPISRTIGSGPVDTIRWALSLQRLMIGADGSEFSIKSTSLDEPLTPLNFNVRASGTQGSAAVDAVKIDNRGVFVQRGGLRVFALTIASDSYDYEPEELSSLVPEIGSPGIVRIAVSDQPDRRVHFVRSDGTAALLVLDRREKVVCWCNIETDGAIEDVVVLPSAGNDVDDQVYYVVKRTVGGTVTTPTITEARYLERWALEDECVGGELNRQADSFVTFDNAGSPSDTVTGLDHLEGRDVVVWADGKCLTDEAGGIAAFRVVGGAITLTDDAASYSADVGVVGLGYTAPWRSGKLLQVPLQLGSSMSAYKHIRRLGLIVADTHALGVRYGPDFNSLQALPAAVRGALQGEDAILEAEELRTFSFPARWDTDSRICLQAEAPRPARLLAAVIDVEAHGG